MECDVPDETVSTLFCDLVGSTEVMARLGDDAEDEVLRRMNQNKSWSWS
jgi:hypothetical protein